MRQVIDPREIYEANLVPIESDGSDVESDGINPKNPGIPVGWIDLADPIIIGDSNPFTSFMLMVLFAMVVVFGIATGRF